MNNVELLYQAHSENLKSQIHEKDDRFSQIKNKDCIAYKNTKRTVDIIEPFTKESKKWLTIGDYIGLEANYLLGKNQDVIASDISEIFLKEAKNEGLIKEYSIVNVEKIHFQDNEFDYVFCKEAYHHFPRAFLGLYEMVRTCKKATIIIEPIDIISKMPALLLLKNILDRFNPYLINKLWRNRFSFEEVGNYVFKVSEREIEKIAMGMGAPCIAFKKINMLLDLKTDKETLYETPHNKKQWGKILRRFKFKNFLCKLHIIPYNHLGCVIFKEMPTEELKNDLKKLDYIIIDLPKNPYVTQN